MEIVRHYNELIFPPFPLKFMDICVVRFQYCFENTIFLLVICFNSFQVWTGSGKLFKCNEIRKTWSIKIKKKGFALLSMVILQIILSGLCNSTDSASS